MPRPLSIFFFLLLTSLARAQPVLKTIVPAVPVVAGESFQVQYVLEGGEKGTGIKPPLFPAFRFVAGPNIYTGVVPGTEGQVPLKNFVYTLEAIRPGTFIIPGASVLINGRTYRSNDTRIQVISVAEALQNQNTEKGIPVSDYFLRPGEDPYKKIRENLFVKVQVDKRSCYTGEPVQATFKLYSRLESKSDIVKNPGFYGFTVYDMVGLADKQAVTEKINGKLFDVHTIRQVQLYPLQAGNYTVDAMEVRNKVEFSRSAVNKKTEQEIVEGIFGNPEGEKEEEPAAGTTVYESAIRTEPVMIKVNPLPEKNRPAGFDGATGRFSISASLAKQELARNEEGFLEITVSGSGNFIQLSAPAVNWPDGMEAFEPTVKDNLDKSTVPLRGNRTFRYPFVCAGPGNYALPALSFSFFDTDSNRFRTLQTEPLTLRVNTAEKKENIPAGKTESIAVKSERAARTAGIVVLLLVMAVLAFWAFKKKEPVKHGITPAEHKAISVEQELAVVHTLVEKEDPLFYTTLHRVIWKILAEKFALSGSSQNKQQVQIKLEEAGTPENVSARLLDLLGDCETVMYTGAATEQDKQAFLNEVKSVLEKITGEKE